MFFVLKKCVLLPAFSKFKPKSMKNILLIAIFALFTLSSQASTINNHMTVTGEEVIISNDPPLYSFVVDTTITGFGTLTYPNGDIFVGNFRKGLKHGNGYIKFPDGREYHGDFKNDKIEGYGTVVYPNGDKYEGNFKDGKYEGNGTLTRITGKKEQGLFKNNSFIG